MLNIAIKAARKSNYRHQLGAVVFKGRRVLATGYNQTNRGTTRCSTKWDGSLHAEQAAILKLLNPQQKDMLVGASIYVCRLRKSGTELGMAKPCPTCMELISLVGIREVIFTNDLGSEEVIKL